MSADPLANLIEPGALAEQAALSEVGLSIAISLKRIADALWGTDGTTGIVELLNGVEMNGRHG